MPIRRDPDLLQPESCVHLYYGTGKGKTTAAMGLALRALGRGKRVVIVQFLKGRPSGELEPLQRLGAVIFRGKAGQRFVSQMSDAEREETRSLQNDNLRRAAALPSDLLILDEACAALQLNMVDEELLRQAVLARPSGRELVLTGRTPSGWMLEAADYITEMRGERHPYDRGLAAREGIEY